MKLQRSIAFFCTLVLLATMAVAQPATTTAKRPLTHQDYDSWRSIVAQQVSRDGKFVAYAYVPEDGDGENHRAKHRDGRRLSCAARLSPASASA